MKTAQSVFSFISGVHPDALAINSTGAATQDGTEYIAEGINNFWMGPLQAIMDYGSGNSNPDVGTVGVPNGVTEAAGVSQVIEALHKGFGVGPGIYKQWGKFDNPSVTGDRILLLSGQGVLVATYPDLNDACWVGGNTANNQAVKDAGDAFYRADDAGGVTVNAAGAYLILPESRDYLFPNGPRRTTAFWHTQNGHGSTNTKIQKYTTEVDASDDVVVTVVNDATNGFSITANMACELYVTITKTSTSTDRGGISKNSAQLTTNIESITAANRMAQAIVPIAGTTTIIPWSGDLADTDTIRPHTDGAADGGGAAGASIHILAIESPRENTNTVQGITY